MVFGAGVVLALIAVAALVLAIVGLTRNPAAPTPAPSASAASTNTQDADRALCQAIAPLIKESTEEKNAFVALGHTGTPERDAGIPGFITSTRDWANRIQPLLDQHSEPARYLTRTLQRYIDDMRLYVSGIRPGQASDLDTETWDDSIIALQGPFEICRSVGVQLW
jgi:hypothetical protein